MKPMDHGKHVFVALSGGVDSTVCAARLLEDGYQVTGIHMETWKIPENEKLAQQHNSSLNLAQQTADFLGIPMISLDLREQFFTEVVQTFIRDYLKGQTPNPCLFCNPQIKWGVLQSYALAHGGDYFATGHYARIRRLESGTVELLKGIDGSKDQSYVLSMLSQQQISRSLLPIGSMTKDAVRIEAQQLSLELADRQDSQDLCFLGDTNYRDFLKHYAPEAYYPGEIVTTKGRVVGEHQGLAFYTVGQRKGIRVAAAAPYYVVDKDLEHNRLIIGSSDLAQSDRLTAKHPNWIGGKPPTAGKTYDVMVRYRAKPIQAELFLVSNDEFELKFNERLRGITPGQVAALYEGEVCLGGGVIQSSG